MAKIVLALGGNALQSGKSVAADDQLAECFNTARNVVELIKEGHDIAIVHGNGPQVGEIVGISELAHKASDKYPIYPFDVCGAFTQGYIGYHLQNAIGFELAQNNIYKNVVTIITQVEVDKNDSAFTNPTKPIGSFYSEEEAEKLKSTVNYTMKEDAGRGYRRVIASPKPIDIVEKNIIKHLWNEGSIVICCGGGGIPVTRKNNKLTGVEAVIDKDFAAAKLTEIINADKLVILTAVEKVFINFNKPNQQALTNISIQEAKKYIAGHQFAPGSMLPKIEAALSFINNNPNGEVLITSLKKAAHALKGETGTLITK